VTQHESSDAYSPLERAVLDYASALTRTPASADPELVRRLRTDLGDKALVELTAAIAWENHRARFNRAFDVAAQGYSEGACCALPQAGPAARPGGGSD